MANSLSAEVWLDQRRWDALEEALKAQGSDGPTGTVGAGGETHQ